MKRLVLVALIALLVSGCAASQFVVYNCVTSPRDCGTAVNVAVFRKSLVFFSTPYGVQSAWLSEKDLKRGVNVTCKPDHTCKVEVRR